MKLFDSLNRVISSFSRSISDVTVNQNLSDEFLQILYRNSKIVEKVINLIVDDSITHIGRMTVSKEGDNKYCKLIEKLFTELEFFDKLKTVAYMARLYGDGYLLMITDEEDYNTPLDPNASTLTGLEVLDPITLAIDTPTARGKFTRYRVTTSDLKYIFIDKSRVIRISGKELFGNMYSNSGGRNDSVVRTVLTDLLNWNNAITSSGDMLSSHSLFIYKMKNLATLVKANDESTIRNRLSSLINSLDSVKGMVLDSTEEADFIKRTYSGVQPILAELKEALASAAELPYTKLWGTPTGGAFSESGASDRYSWATSVENYQNTKLIPAIKEFVKLLLKFNGYDSIDFDWSCDNPLQLTQKEESDIKLSLAKADNIYIDAGVLRPEEVRESRFANYQFSQEINLQDALEGSLRQLEDVERTDVERSIAEFRNTINEKWSNLLDAEIEERNNG